MIPFFSISDTGEGLKVENCPHFLDIGRLMTSLSAHQSESSSPMQMNPLLSNQIEIVALHLQLLNNSQKAIRNMADFGFLFYFKDTFEDYFNFTVKMQDNQSYSVAFPQICQGHIYA